MTEPQLYEAIVKNNVEVTIKKSIEMDDCVTITVNKKSETLPKGLLLQRSSTWNQPIDSDWDAPNINNCIWRLVQEMKKREEEWHKESDRINEIVKKEHE